MSGGSNHCLWILKTAPYSTMDAILNVSEHHFYHNETETYKVFRIEFPFQTERVTFKTIKGSHIEIPYFMRQQSCAIIVVDNGKIMMKIPHSVIEYHYNVLFGIKNNIIEIYAKINI